MLTNICTDGVQTFFLILQITISYVRFSSRVQLWLTILRNILLAQPGLENTCAFYFAIFYRLFKHI